MVFSQRHLKDVSLHAILNWRYDDIVEGDPGKHLLIGFDSNANLLEIGGVTMPDLTDEEYDALDEYYTKNPPKLSGNGKSGFFAKHAEKGNTLIFVDDLSANWLRIKAEAANTTPQAIIRELVGKEIAAASASFRS
ncbi:MAG: hypothetical protein FWC06_09250 [Treponema sp.]|nr:hypothetical protein [Treponema sp.]